MSEKAIKTDASEMPSTGISFSEAVGKIVAEVNVCNDPESSQAVAIYFTDGTHLNFDLIPRLEIRVDYSRKSKNGEQKVIKDFGVLPELKGEDYDAAI